jgi:hypothetical protein
MAERTTVRLPESLLKRAKRKAARDGRTLTSLLEDGLRLVLEERPTSDRRPLPRVSRAKGGLMPGVDIVRLADLQTAEDIEALARSADPL